MVYLHGMPGCRLENTAYFSDEALARAGVRLISIDRPGWGRSDPVAGDRIARVSRVVPLCDYLGVDSFSVLAVSSGGSYALTLAATAPERVERVLLVSAQMPYDDESAIQGLLADQLALVPLLRKLDRATIAPGVEDYRQRVVAKGLDALEDLKHLPAPEQAFLAQRVVRERFDADVQEAFAVSSAGALDDLMLWPTPLEIDPANVRCPVRAVHGSIDNWEPLPNLVRILDQMPDTQLFVMDGCNHFGPMLFPEVLLSLV